MTTTTHIHTENTYRLDGSMKKAFAGNFSHKLAGHACYILFSLDEFDQNLVAGIPLKDGEKIFRAETDRSAITGIRFFVKVNINNGLVYFVETDENNCEAIRFETRGNKTRYINLMAEAI
jgi:hypothetical protein